MADAVKNDRLIKVDSCEVPGKTPVATCSSGGPDERDGHEIKWSWTRSIYAATKVDKGLKDCLKIGGKWQVNEQAIEAQKPRRKSLLYQMMERERERQR